jgi:ribosomal protein L34E
MADPPERRPCGWQHAAVVTAETCLHCGRALEAATTWRVAIAVVDPDDQAGPERALGGLHPRCVAAYLAAQNAGADGPTRA